MLPSTTSTRAGWPAKALFRLAGDGPSVRVSPRRREADAAPDRVAALAGEGAGELGEPHANAALVNEAADVAEVEVVGAFDGVGHNGGLSPA
jgi:hypothetical protein